MIILPEREKIAKESDVSESVLNTLDAFYTIASAAQWQTPVSVKQTFPTADILKSGRVIFDINNEYHLVIKINYELQAIRVQFFEKHGNLTQILNTNVYLDKVQNN